MKVSVTTIPLLDLDVDLLLVPLTEDGKEEALSSLADSLGSTVKRAADDFTGKPGNVVLLYPAESRAKRVALLGLGPAESLDAEGLRHASAAGASLALAHKAETSALRVPTSVGVDAELVGQALVEGFMLGAYRFLEYKTIDAPFDGPSRLVLHADQDEKAVRRGSERGRVVSEATTTARDLVNLSPDEKTPTLLAKAVEKLGKKQGFEVLVWDKALIEEEQMGGLLAVNRGSVEPPVFIELTWQPENALNTKPVILVGKGVTFDTGGISLKTAKGLEAMKSDMGGAAAVIGAFEALAKLEVPLYVVGLIPASDNRPGENAYVPGDVLRMHSGKTVEVLNTDAEGRLLLADALSYAKTYRPELVIDLATLTGAQVIALGSDVAALMTNAVSGSEERLAAMEAAGSRSGDRVHRMPMHDVYGKLLESQVADVKNVGGREAGSITAAKFLEHFVDYPWMHLDIAGPSFLLLAKPYRPIGGTGFGVRLLTEFLRAYANPKNRK